MRHSRAFPLVALLLFPLIFTACKRMVAIAEPVAVHHQVYAAGGQTEYAELISQAGRLKADTAVAAALAQTPVDFSKNDVLVICLANGVAHQARIEAIQKKDNKVFVQVVKDKSAQALRADGVPTNPRIVAVVDKIDTTSVSKEGIKTIKLDHTDVVVEVK